MGFFLKTLPHLDILSVSSGLDKNRCVLNIDILGIVSIVPHTFLICMHGIPSKVMCTSHMDDTHTHIQTCAHICSGWK